MQKDSEFVSVDSLNDEINTTMGVIFLRKIIFAVIIGLLISLLGVEYIMLLNFNIKKDDYNTTVYMAQLHLINLKYRGVNDGFIKWGADGKYGVITKAVIEEFQRDCKKGVFGDKYKTIAVNGMLNEETFKALIENSDLKSDDEILWLGVLSAKYESNGHPGTISHGKGDSGEVSYGAYQFASKFDIPKDFVEWLKDNNKDFYDRLNKAYIRDGNIYGKNFDEVWTDIAYQNFIGFLQLQHEYAKNKYYKVVAEMVLEDTGFDFDNRSVVLQNVLWSRAVQHGVNGGTKVISNALSKINIKTATDEEIIRAIYQESGKVNTSKSGKIDESNFAKSKDGRCSFNSDERNYCVNYAKENGIYGKSMDYFENNSMEVQVSVWRRLNVVELNDAIKLLKSLKVQDITKDYNIDMKGVKDSKVDKEVKPKENIAVENKGFN